MRPQGAEICKPLQSIASPLANIKTSVGLSPDRPADGLPPVEYQRADHPMVYQLYQLLFNAVSEDTSLMEEFFGNDSLGG